MCHSFKESWTYTVEFIYCMDLGSWVETHVVLLLQPTNTGHLAIWAPEIRLLQISSQLKVPIRGCLTDLCLFPASKGVILNTELLLKQCRAEVSWNVWWRWAKLWAVLLSTLWGDASTAYGKLRAQLQVRQFHLNFSTVRAGCQWDHGNLNCRGCALILCLNLMNLLTQSNSFEIQPSRAVSAGTGAVQPLTSNRRQTAYLEQLVKGNQTCTWEGAALVK